MLNKIIFSGLCISISAHVFALTETEQKQVNQLVQLFQKNDVQKISQQIRYPLIREVPIPAIQNDAEMQKHFHQVFDQKLMQKIAKSKDSQWTSMGWRGLMLDGGTIWFDGSKITAVNYSSVKEQQIKLQYIEQQKRALHTSLKTFKAPIFSFKTKGFLVRIDEMPNGKYRYASWKVYQQQSDKPSLVLNNGKVTFEGSGGNHHYDFVSGTHRYIVERMVLGSSNETPELTLAVTQRGKTILKQTGKLVAN